MTIDEVKLLVEWKLSVSPRQPTHPIYTNNPPRRHGTFRPTLMKLVSSNEPKTVKETIQKAINLYRSKSDVSAALGILTQLKGIGPATASLLLAVHDADNVIFFADEAFYWLCLGGSKGPIKYNAKEYAALNEKARALSERLGVKAVDIERVAFVLMKEGAGAGVEVSEEKVKVESKAPVKPSVKASVKPPAKAPGKRKVADESSDANAPPPRRSKRGKQS